MRDLITQLHRLKMILASLLLTAAGIVLVTLGHNLDVLQTWSWLRVVPWSELGGILVGAGLIGIWLDSLFQREQEANADHRLREALEDQAPIMRDAVLGAFAAKTEDIARVATPETLDALVENSLALRLGDEQFAAEIFADIRGQIIEAHERWTDATLAINLSPIDDEPDYFAVTVRWEYTTTPHHAQRQFVCLSDKTEYQELTRSHGETSAWYFIPDPKYEANDRKAYELLQFSVNGEERRIRRSSRKDYQAYTVDIGADHVAEREEVTVSYTFQTITRRNGHLLFFDIEQPTKDIAITFDHTGCGLASISVIDLFPSLRQPRIEHSPEEVTPRVVRIELDGWTFPRSGVAFVWSTSCAEC